ncbi:guanitoxin biosynthesis L-enduracididine beta-hydroxylase GntD [Flavobacteriaceae bacterium M23B6Z8]
MKTLHKDYISTTHTTEKISSSKLINILDITFEEKDQLNELTNQLIEEFEFAENPDFIYYASLFALRLPQRILKYLHDFKYKEDNYGVCVIRGYEIDHEKIGSTPNVPSNGKNDVLREEILLILFNAVLGNLFSWSTQRDGAIINDILPMKGHEKEQLSTASETLLEWHIEEAFHHCRPDNLSLLCLRNDDKIATTFCSVNKVDLPEEIKKVLFQPRFVIATDNNFNSDKFSHPELKPVLFGAYEDPYICIDPAFMHAAEGDEEAMKALDFIYDQINNRLDPVVLEPGDFCFIDNYRAVHGRKPFKPKYDGNDRWLKRVLTTRDLRKSRAIRKNAMSRVLITE